MKTKYRSMHNERNKAKRAFQSKKDTGECFSTKLKSTCKNSGTFEGKKIYPKKSLTSLLHQAIEISWLGFCPLSLSPPQGI